MVTRDQRKSNDPSLSAEIKKARQSLEEKNWTMRAAARALGYSWGHFVLVMTGRRESKRLLAAVCALPERGEGDA